RNYAVASWQPLVGTVGLVVSTASFIGVTVVLAPALVRLASPWAKRRSGVFGVAVRVLAAEPRRTGIAAASVAVSVAFASMLAAAIPAIDSVTVQLFDRVVAGRVYVSTMNFNNNSSIDPNASP